jgi:hypothetical protein
MMRWFLLCSACLAVYWVPVWMGPASGQWFFVSNSGWSLILCAAVLAISRSRTALAVAVLECAAIAINLACMWQYMTVRGWLYGAYSEVIEAIVIAEIAVLAMGAPCNGIRRVVRQHWGSRNHWGAAYLRRGLDREATQ